MRRDATGLARSSPRRFAGLIPRSAVYLYFAIVASIFAAVVPVFEAPDEPHHLDYVGYLTEHRTLPNQLVEAEKVFREGHQPPLYYVLAAAVSEVVQPGRRVEVALEVNPAHALHGGRRRDVPYYLHPAPASGSTAPFADARARLAFYCMRALGIAFGLLNLRWILDLSERVIADRLFSRGPALFAATLPQFLFISASVSNDGLAFLLATGVIRSAFLLLERPEAVRPYVEMGLWLGLGLCAKKTLLMLVPPLVLLAAWLWVTQRSSRARVAAGFAGAAALSLALGGWIFARNLVLYGDLLGTAMERETLPFIVADVGLFSSYFLSTFWKLVYQSFVGLFGWMQVRLPLPAYGFYALGLALASLGVARCWLREPVLRPTLAFAVVLTGSCLAGVIYYNTTYLEPQGRFLFPVIAPIGLLIALGLRSFAAGIRARPAVIAFAGVWLFGAVLCDVVSLARIAAWYG